MTMSLENLRRQYTQGGLLESAAADDPFVQFDQWMQMALDHAPAEWVEPYAMTLSTSSSVGAVSSRIVLLRGFGPDGFLFYTNYESQKAKDLESNPRAALLFYWGYLERQIRVSGPVARVSREKSADYFHRRPRGSQISASVSRQSTVVRDRHQLEMAANTLLEELDGNEVPLPDFWGGYGLQPTRFEFWQGREDRLHDRLIYEKEQAIWIRNRLSP